MNFDPDLLETYRTLLKTTDLQRAYPEFIRLFRFLRNEMERQLPDFRFQSSITENAMDYSYFSFTNSELKEKGLKLAVVFVHRDFRLEVWLSGGKLRHAVQFEQTEIFAHPANGSASSGAATFSRWSRMDRMPASRSIFMGRIAFPDPVCIITHKLDNCVLCFSESGGDAHPPAFAGGLQMEDAAYPQRKLQKRGASGIRTLRVLCLTVILRTSTAGACRGSAVKA